MDIEVSFSHWMLENSPNNDIAKMKCKIDEKATFESFIKKTMTDW